MFTRYPYHPLKLLLALLLVLTASQASEAVWQWSAPMGEGRAFLWIPEDCERVRAVVVAQDNMIEQGILEHPQLRRTLASLGIAELFISPAFDRPFDFMNGAGECFERLMGELARESGYGELADTPVIPMGHSACASFPWNFAAWKPSRTLAVLSLKGDAPQTPLTGSGKPNPDWGGRRIDGVPGLMVMSEAEWWEDRLTPALDFRHAHPGTALSVLADAGQGHFDASDALVGHLGLFIRKAAERRLPLEGMSVLRPVDPNSGWLVDRWRGELPPRATAAPFASYEGPREEAFWCFDEETARATETHQGRSRGKKPQQVDFVQEGTLSPISSSHAGVTLRFLPEDDGVGFQLSGAFITPLPRRAPVAAKDKPPAPTLTVPGPAEEGTHAQGPVALSRISGPVEQLGSNRFRVALNRTFSLADTRGDAIWLLASHPGDEQFRGAVQQAVLRFTRPNEGRAQTLSFPEVPNQRLGTATVALAASSSAGVPVSYFVREGPAFVREGVLHLTAVPPRTRLPVKVTVVAWQFGRSSEPKLRFAIPVERSFTIGAERAGAH